MKYKLSVIGFGVMGQAIVLRIIESGKLKAEEICAFDLDADKVSAFTYNINVGKNISETVSNSERIMLAVKPQHYSDICENTDFMSVKTVISIMAGVQIATLREKLKTDTTGIVRVMPNTPCALGKGVCGVTFDKTTDTEKDIIFDLLSACGAVVVTSEDKFDAITSVSGSGPAYVYMFADGMIRGGLKGGLSYEESKELALNTIIGAAELAKNTDEQLSVLVDKVCSKGGTTIEAVNVFKDGGLVDLIVSGVNACREKSLLLSGKEA